jgi:hypothetical protein
MVEIDEEKYLADLLLGPEGRAQLRRQLYNKFRFGNVFTPEEVERIKKAIKEFVKGKITSWAAAMYYGGMQQLLSGFEDRCCRYCWRDLKSTLEAIDFHDEAIMKKVEMVLKNPQLQLIARC